MWNHRTILKSSAAVLLVLLGLSSRVVNAQTPDDGEVAGTTTQWILASTYECFVGGCLYQDAVLRYDAAIGTFLGVHIANIPEPTGLTFHPTRGTLLVASRSASIIKEYNARTGVYIGDFILPGPEGLHMPQAILVRSNGNVLVTSTQSLDHQEKFNGILEFSGSTGVLVSPFVDGGYLGQNCGDDDCLFGASAMALGPNGNLYVASSSNDKVIEYNGTTGAYIDAFTSTKLEYPTGIAIRPNGIPRAGNIHVTSRYRNPSTPGDLDKVLEFDKTTRALVSTNGGVFAGGMVKPGPLWWHSTGALLVDDRSQTEVAPLFADRINKLQRDSGAFLGTFTLANENRLHQVTGMIQITVDVGNVDDDYDNDNDVDVKDFAAFQRCFGPAPGTTCTSTFDEDQNNNINQADLPQFHLQFTGPVR